MTVTGRFVTVETFHTLPAALSFGMRTLGWLSFLQTGGDFLDLDRNLIDLLLHIRNVSFKDFERVGQVLFLIFGLDLE